MNKQITTIVGIVLVLGVALGIWLWINTTKPQQGEVIAVGPGARNEQGQLVALDVKEGDRILFGKWSGTEVKIDGEDLLIMKESDILGVLEHSEKKKKAA